MTATYITVADLVGSWLSDVERGDPPVRYTLAPPFDALDVRPGRLILFGGAPGSGKTAALMQIGIDLLRLNPAARLLVANVECGERRCQSIANRRIATLDIREPRPD